MYHMGTQYLKPSHIKYGHGCVEEFMHEKRSSMRIVDQRDLVIEGTYLNWDESAFMSIVDDKGREHDMPKCTKMMIWYRTKWVCFGFKK
jgi:hypothetical protein